jgi:hypothetical protein
VAAVNWRIEDALIGGEPSLLWFMASGVSQENCGEFLRRYDFELGVGAVARLLIQTPSSKLGGVTEAVALHVIVCDLYN